MMPVTGRAVPQLAVYDAAVQGVMQKWAIPGASVAITDQGRLVYARGFGFADRERGLAVQPSNLFRLASISKTLTGMTILKLVEEGRFSLDARMMELLPNLTVVPGATMDPRVRQTTVRQLLQHTGGWAKEIPDDAALQFSAAARALNVDRATITPEQMCRFIVSQRLDFEPGSRYYYSQAGYLLLGRIIERVTGKKYEEAVREKILAPAGANSLKVGRSLLAQKEPDEVRYYNFPGATLGTVPGVVPGVLPPFERQYGNLWMEQAEAYGGWIGSAVDLMKYINAVEGRRGPALLNSASLASIIQRPSVWPTGEYVGLTWRITPVAGGQHWWHSGGAVGTRNLLTRRQNNRNWVVLMNMRPEDEDTIIGDLFRAFSDAEARVASWPSHDLFADFAGPQLSTDVQTLSFTHLQGSAELPPAQVVQATAAPTAVNFTISAPVARWLKLDRVSGLTPAALRVSIDPAGLEPGSYEGSFTLTAPQSSNTTRTVNVSLRVTAATLLSGIRSTASLAVATEVAGLSRLIAETPIDMTERPVVRVGGIEALVVDWAARQVDFVVPEGVVAGEAEVSVVPGPTAAAMRGRVRLVDLAPALFVPRAGGLRPTLIRSSAEASQEEIFDCGREGCRPLEIDLGPEEEVVSLRIPMTGTRSQAGIEAYAVTIGELPGTVTALESVAAVDGLGVDWITVTIPRELVGRGEAEVMLSVGEKTANPLRILLK